MNQYKESFLPTNSEILIVDDNNTNCLLLAKMLGLEGYSISVASSGREAIKKAKEILPDLILMDVVMPDMDGFIVCKKLKENEKTKEIPVIFVTGKATEEEDLLKGFQAGGVDYVTKPLRKAELLARVNVHVQLKKTMEEKLEAEQKAAAYKMAVTANHDIRQPLAVLSMSSQFFLTKIDTDQLDGDAKNCLNKMDGAINKIVSILKRYMDAEKESIYFTPYSETQDMVEFKTPNQESPSD